MLNHGLIWLILTFSYMHLSANYSISEIGRGRGFDFSITNELITSPLPENGTDLLFNRTASFRIKHQKFLAEIFIATREGTVLGCNNTVEPGKMFVLIDQSAKNAVYTGITIAKNGRHQYFYGADFANGFIDIFDSDFKLVHSFTDDDLPSKYAPFNIQHINEKLYITYASRSGEKEGYVEVFDINTAELIRLVSHGRLNSPRAVALAPENFGNCSGALLVGNYGDGRINAFDPQNGKFVGTLKDQESKPLVIEGLWDLKFRPHLDPEEPATLYFSTCEGRLGIIRTEGH